MGADAIFAEPGTITGSIGVVGGKIAIEGLLRKIGVTTSVIRRGQNSGILSLTSGFTESERQAMQASIDNVYELFTRKAAEGRKMDVVALEKLARGRVYTGRQALKIGLVDHLGTLADAVAHARKLAGDTEGKLELDELPKPVSPLEMLLSETPQGPQPIEAWLQALPESLRPAVDHVRVLDLFTREHALTILPFTVRFE
jgi:protease-4